MRGGTNAQNELPKFTVTTKTATPGSRTFNDWGELTDYRYTATENGILVVLGSLNFGNAGLFYSYNGVLGYADNTGAIHVNSTVKLNAGQSWALVINYNGSINFSTDTRYTTLNYLFIKEGGGRKLSRLRRLFRRRGA